ncbi:MAG: arylsulfatase [Planctomycetota bacterium]
MIRQLSAALLIFFASVGQGCAAPDATDRPNIIMILADDLGWGDLSCYGQRNWTTPQLDRMAAEGMRFTDAYAGSTVCAPSRATLLTGLHTGHVYMRGNGDVQFPEDPDELTIASMLSDAGYATAMIGKSGLACNSTDAMLPNRKGFDHFYGLLAHKAAHRHYPKVLFRNGELVELAGNSGYLGEQYASELFVAEALEWIEAHHEDPFFLHLALTPPHADLTVPDRFAAPFRGRFEENGRGYGGYYKQPEPRATYAGMVAFIDDAVGQVLQRLRDIGIDERTVVVFASDNGPAREGGAVIEFFDSNGPFRGGKRDLYEGGIRTPQLLWAPGFVRAGSETSFVTAFWDLTPTFLELAGLPTPDSLDGISIVPIMKGATHPPAAATGRHLYWEFHEHGGKQAVRFGQWKAVRLNVGAVPGGPVELFDLQADPGEQIDLSERYPEVAAKLAALMDESRTPSSRFRFGTN